MAERPKGRVRAQGPSDIVSELAAAGFDHARQIARGAVGVVFCCRETALGRNVAIKVLPTFVDDDSRERFLREGYAMGGLSGHPNIVNIQRVGFTVSGRPYIVMSYCAAGSLAVRVQQEGPITWPEALRIGVKLCGALETAHLTGTLHRDIKPANVLVNDYGEPQLTDFGTAHIAGGYETAAGLFSGTVDYLAPEVLTGSPATVGTDVYGLGATIYALLAGNAAYERRSGDDLLAHYTADEQHAGPEPASTRNPGCGVLGARERDVVRPRWTADVSCGVRPRVAGRSASQRLETRLHGDHCRRCRLRAPGGQHLTEWPDFETQCPPANRRRGQRHQSDQLAKQSKEGDATAPVVATC